MFTGLIESLGRVAAVTPVPGGYRLAVEASIGGEVALGDSVAVNGVCLTVVAVDGRALAFDLGPETARVTSLGDLRPGAAVNLERAMRADTRVGGHFVQGHVDGTGTLLAVIPEAEFTWMTFSFPPEQAAYLIPKGAVAVDGVSLTVARLSDASFDVQIIPFTWTHTNLSRLPVGARANLEFDMLGKYAVRAAELAAARPAAVRS
jgi:riboflavin synthase alpha subunit